MELYTWQEKCISEWQNNQTRGIVNVITGAGKTVLALAAMAKLREQYQDQLRIRIVVPTITLARQWLKELIRFFPEMEFAWKTIGFYYGQVKSDPDRQIMIYVINSARSVLSAHILQDMNHNKHVFLVCDECHRCTAEINRRIFSFKQNEQYRDDLYHCIGLSATPRNQYYEKVLVPALGEEIYSYHLKEAGEDHLISPFALMNISVTLNGEESAEYGKITDELAKLYGLLMKNHPHLRYLSSEEFYAFIFSEARDDVKSICAAFANKLLQRRSLVLKAENRTHCVLSILKQIPSDEQVILFAERIEQADDIYHTLLPIYGSLVTHYHSEMPAQLRHHCLSLFRIGEARILISCKALDEGLDVPDASVGIVMSSTSVSRQRIQRLGRILRSNAQKDIAVLYYIYTQGTTEEKSYLPEINTGVNEDSLSYDAASESFFSINYSLYAVQMYKQLPQNLTDMQKKEINKCLEEGILTADRFLNSKAIQNHIEHAESRHERNYWIVMKHLSAVYKQEDMDI